jgi:O-antigen ligase
MRATADPSNRFAQPLDAAGVGLVALTVGWAMLVSGSSGGSALPFVSLIIAVTLGVGLARWLEARLIRSVPFLVVCGAGGFFVLAWLGSDRWGDPLGYANASAALAVEAMVAALMLVMSPSPLPVRFVGILGALLFGATPFILDARTAGFLVAAIALAFGVGWVMRWPRRGVAVAAGLMLVTLLSSIGLGVTGAGKPGSVTARVIDTSLTEARLALWHDALDIVSEHPITGVGWGGFATTSPIARSDEDRRYAHNEFLQVAAESGILGGLLVVLLFAWAFARIYVGSGPDPMAVLGAIALAAVGISASVDYVLRFPTVGVTAAVLVGAAQAGRIATTPRTRTYESAEFGVPA